MPKKGYKQTECHKKKVSQKLTGYVQTTSHKKHTGKAVKLALSKPDAKKKLSKAKRGKNNPMYGRTGEKSHLWKGDDINIFTKHGRVIEMKGKASNYTCVGDGINQCNKQAHDWSNIDHKYSLNPDDYQPRCVSCHRIYDFKYNNLKN